ncbi:MAG: hypothetical protein NTY88_05860 [Bacteroidetes bacterium]|nr:hypothetical protein [Bacteroidota bacterium]
MILRKIILVFVFMLTAFTAFPQAKNHFSKKEMKKSPVWIAMIKDEHVNYFEALKAFELYFTTHKFPVMEEEEMARNEKLKERILKSEAKYKKKKRKEMIEPNALEKDKHEQTKLAFEVKRFNHWEMQTRPFVKEDGTVMSAEEQMKVWKESKGE